MSGIAMPKMNVKNTESAGLPSKALLQKIAFRLVGLFIVFAIQMLLCRLIGPNQFGHFAVITTVVGMLVTVSTFGFDSVVQIFLPKYNEDAGLKKGLVRYSNRFIFFASLICMSGVLLFLLTYSKRLSNLTFCEALLWAMLLIPFAALLNHTDTIVSKITRKSAAVPVIVTISFVTFCISLYRFYADKKLLVDTVIMIAFIVSAVVYVAFRTKSKRLLNNREVEAKYEITKWTKYAGQFFLADILNFLFVNGAVLLLSYFADNLTAGYFFIALKLSTIVTIAAGIVISTSISTIYENFKAGQKKKYVQSINGTAFKILSVVLPAALLLALSGKFVLGLFHPKIAGEITLLLVLLVVQIINSLSTLNGKVLTVTGRRKEYLILLGISFLILFVCGSIFIPIYKLTGVSIALIASSLFYFVSTTVAVRK